MQWFRIHLLPIVCGAVATLALHTLLWGAAAAAQQALAGQAAVGIICAAADTADAAHLPASDGPDCPCGAMCMHGGCAGCAGPKAIAARSVWPMAAPSAAIFPALDRQAGEGRAAWPRSDAIRAPPRAA